ncbi:energy transducer TonB family protein [Ruegeria faecimaris]|uniref:energy transducer TonB family protein n=1 Tax=Ruegeria faecimaris TaxID=686389 RepID=UPI002492DF1D|nr:TonB family protein [Ruegeria faecimaris]
MIRRSVFIAIIAVLVSLLIHLGGLSVTAPHLTETAEPAGPADAIALGNEFEEIADVVADPVEPEPAPESEPEPEEPLEPEPAPEPEEVPVSEALVASDNPQQVPSPDLGKSEIVRPVVTETVEPSETTSETPSDANEAASQDEDSTPQAEPSEQAETPEGVPEASPVQAEEQAAVDPAPAEVPTPEPSPVPDIPLIADIPDVDIPLVEPEPEPEAEEETETALTSSVRPKLPDQRPSSKPQGVLPGSNDFSDLRFPEKEVESPLSQYKRAGIDPFTRGNTSAGSGGRGPGNSTKTNYAGRVLMHLNRAPLVYVSARGFAQVFFQINPDGTLAFVDVVDSSGSPEVDRAAKAQVRAASPFPLPPGGVSRSLSFFYNSN